MEVNQNNVHAFPPLPVELRAARPASFAKTSTSFPG